MASKFFYSILIATSPKNTVAKNKILKIKIIKIYIKYRSDSSVFILDSLKILEICIDAIGYNILFLSSVVLIKMLFPILLS